MGRWTHPVTKHNVHLEPAALLAAIQEPPPHMIELAELVRLSRCLLIVSHGDAEAGGPKRIRELGMGRNDSNPARPGLLQAANSRAG